MRRASSRSPRAARMSATFPSVTARATDVPQPLVHRQFFLAPDAQGFVEVAPGCQDVGDLPQRDRARPDVPQPLVHRQFFLAPDAQGLVEVAPVRQDVGDLPQRDRARPDVAQPLEGRPRLTQQPLRGVPFAPGHQDRGQLDPRLGDLPLVAERLGAGNPLVADDALGGRELAALLQGPREAPQQAQPRPRGVGPLRVTELLQLGAHRRRLIPGEDPGGERDLNALDAGHRRRLAERDVDAAHRPQIGRQKRQAARERWPEE
jgi:hypothetical protein